jgi:menaquinone-specific isochorismate synthase
MRAAWSSPTTRIDASEGVISDPGTGQDRYRVAMYALRTSPSPLAIAAFTFDPDEPGSVVIVPEAGHALPAARAVPRGRVVDDGKAEWDLSFARSTEALASGAVEKLVLARRVTCRFDGEVDPVRVWQNLVAQNPGTYCFLVDGFTGASPELLIRVEGPTVESLALAGTGVTDYDLAGELIDTEHRLAADSVAEALAPHVEGLVSERGIHRFGGLAHVGTRFTGELRDGVTVLDLLAAVHPTAAVAGTPRDEALRMIREIEGPRGLYSGPVGWFDREGNGEFAIALRCGTIEGDTAVLHAGGGLVAGADRDREWRETDLKLQPMLSALGIED